MRRYLVSPRELSACSNTPEDRLHCDKGPALGYRNGREFYFLRGIRVPKKYVFAGAKDISLTQVAIRTVRKGRRT